MNLQHWKLAITPLSPIHMGTDADYEPANYIIDNGVLYEFDSLAALSALPEAQRKRLNTILNGRSSQNMLLEVQSFFYHNRDRLIAVARHQVKVNHSVESFYQERIGKVSQHESGGRRVQNKLEIERTAWNPLSGDAILPGSGLKGAIRTALLNAKNEGRSLDYALKRDRRQANRKLQQQLFKGSFHTDPLRLVNLGDASLEHPQNFATKVSFALNRKKQAVTDANGNLRQSKAEQAGLYQLLECLPAMQPRAFTGSLGIQRESGMPDDKWPSIQFDLGEIATACNHFYLARIKQEMALLKQRRFVDNVWSERIELLLSQGWFEDALGEKRAFLLRVGRHSGAESLTLEGLRNIKIMKGRGEKPDFLDHAKTIWLAGDERQLQTNMMPFGWLLVEPFTDAADLPLWPKKAIDPAIRHWRQNIVEKQQQEQQRLQQQEEDKRLAQELESRIAAEQAAAVKARREQQAAAKAKAEADFSALTENRKTLHRIRELVEVLKAQQHSMRDTSAVNQRLNVLKNEASRWPDAQEREDAAVLMEEYYELTGWHQTGIPKKKKLKQEQKKRDLIQHIREGQS